MRYEESCDRYNAIEWSGVTSEIGQALAIADEVVIIGNQALSEELVAFQLVIASTLHCPVELLQCWDDRSPGHVRSSSTEEAASPSEASNRVIFTLGRTPTPRALGFDHTGLLVCLADEVSPTMFDLTNGAAVLPISSRGWKLSHIAFHRLLDIETEQSASYQYHEMFLTTPCLSRPLCSILALVLKSARQAQTRLD
jgi:hypothetical protein